MATSKTDISTTNEDMKPRRKELINYMDAISNLILYKALDINGYTPNKFENIDLEYDNEHIIKCTKIVNEFKKNYSNYTI